MKNILQGYLNEAKGKLKQRVAIYIQNDLMLVEGKQEEILGRLQFEMGKPKSEILNLIAQL
jgi:uncharacterized protein YjbJ (UPF0337 family)